MATIGMRYWIILFFRLLFTLADEGCGPPPDMPRGSALTEEESFPVDSEVKYKCNFGFYFVGISRIATCKLNRNKELVWTTNNAECKPVSCAEPQLLENGQILGNRYTYPNSIEYVCDAGYNIKGIKVRFCGTDGEWSGREPSCTIVKCEKPKYVENASVSYDSTVYQSVANYKCNDGLQLEGNAAIKCNAEGKWEGILPKCIEVACSEPEDPENGKSVLIHGARIQGSVVVYNCESGFQLVGSSIAKCLPDGKWSSKMPNCTKPCSVPKLGRGKLGTIVYSRYEYFVQVKPQTKVEHGKKLLLRCDKNYEIPTEEWHPGDIEITCDLGDLKPKPACHPAQCRIPPPSDGKGSPTENYGSKHEDTVLYVEACSTFQRILRNKTARCHYGDWIITGEICQDTRCDSELLKHSIGLHMTNSRYYKSEEFFEVHCQNGYEKMYDKIFCKNGEWQFNSLPCKPANCNESPPTIKNGQMQIFSRTHNSKVIYYCFPPYKISNEYNNVTCKFGKWVGNPVCENNQCNIRHLQKYEGVKVENKSIKSEEWYLFTCKDGYDKIKPFILCKDGKWQESPNGLCTPGPCSVPFIPNGEIKQFHIERRWFSDYKKLIKAVIGSSVKSETVYYVFCENSYKFQGISKTGRHGKPIQCNKTRWIPKPECLLFPTTGPPNTDEIKITENPLPENSLKNISNELKINNSKQHDPDLINLDSLIKCSYQIKDENLIGFINGFTQVKVGDFIHHGTQLKFSCASPGRYHLIGPSEAICKNGTWEPHFPSCHVPNKENDVIIDVTSVKPIVSLPDNLILTEKDDQLSIICFTNKGNSYPTLTSDAAIQNKALIKRERHLFYTLILINKMTKEHAGNYSCKSLYGNKHSVLIKVSSVSCENPGTVEYASMNGETFEVGEKIHYKCNEGYKLFGDATLLCLQTGEWSNQKPRCEEIKCPAPIKPENGEVFYESLLYNSEILYECKFNYKLIGESKAKCRYDGQWSHVPVCAGTCQHPGIVEHASIFGENFEVNDEVHYECDNGYKLTGNATLHCLITGEWTSEKPKCKEIYCPVPTDPENGVVEFYSLTYNSEITYKCNEGYQLVGEEKAKCKYNSEWSSVPSCKVIQTCNVYALLTGLPDDIAVEFGVPENVIDDTNIRLVCSGPNLVLLGQSYAICSGGSWNIGKTECVSGCSPIEKPVNSSLILDNIKESYRIGEMISFSCPENEKLDKDLELILCLHSGWSDQEVPSCISSKP